MIIKLLSSNKMLSVKIKTSYPNKCLMKKKVDFDHFQKYEQFEILKKKK